MNCQYTVDRQTDRQTETLCHLASAKYTQQPCQSHITPT